LAAVEPIATTAPTLQERFIWIGLAACASALLLSVTNHLTQNVAAIPFLWVLPLSLYLLSFILCFDSDRWYITKVFRPLGAIALVSMAYAISSGGGISNLKYALGYFCSALFVLFMVCHGELAHRRPAPAYLTSFYLMVSIGGAIGGLFIGFAAPYLFNALYDLQVVVCLTAALFAWMLWNARDKNAESAAFLDESYDKIVVGVLTVALIGFTAVRYFGARAGKGPAFLAAPYDAGVLLGLAAAIAIYVLWRGRGSLREDVVIAYIAAATTLGMAGYLGRDTYNTLSGSRVLARNFYGALNVYDEDTDGKMGPVRVLRHGTIDHGEQFLRPENQRFATTYYSAQSGVGLAIHQLQNEGAMNVGVIGLGAGTLTTYGRPIDRYTVYDINPIVVNIARTQFRFLTYCMAKKEVVLGDARLMLEGEQPKQFDLLAVDAFSGDAIPVHLLTREAMALYWRHLRPDGVLAVHVSNRYLGLGPVVALAAGESGKKAMMVSNDEDEDTEVAASDWVLVTSRPGFFDQPAIKAATGPINPVPGLRPWTDDYSNLYRILK
jgi:SAM-dependent methyltransferase